jgi:hypothetical protein
MASKDEFLTYLDALGGYIESGIDDYLKDNSIEDYIAHGEGLDDFATLIATRKIREFVKADEYSWFDGQFAKSAS